MSYRIVCSNATVTVPVLENARVAIKRAKAQESTLCRLQRIQESHSVMLTGVVFSHNCGSRIHYFEATANGTQVRCLCDQIAIPVIR